MPRPPAASVPETAAAALLLSGSQVRSLIDPPTLLAQLREAMRSYAAAGQPRGRRTHSRIPSRQPHSVMIVFPGLVPGIPAYTVKINAKLPESVPSVRGLIALHDLETGALLAVMDSIAITAIRTGLVGGLAADALARRSIDTVAMIGAGTQGREQLRALKLVRSFSTVRLYDTDRQRADHLARELSDLGVSFTMAPSVAAAVKDADVVITATWAKQPIVTRDMIAPGTHITAIGADEPGKAELDRALLETSKFVCDDADLAVEMGALAGVGLGRDVVHCTLGDALNGTRVRTSDDDITVFGSVGLPCQDLPAAWMVYQKARDSGTHFSFHD